MAEYIEREALMNALDYCSSLDKKQFASILDELPASDVAPVVHGRWVLTRTSFTQAHYECSICKHIDQRAQNHYCGWCGAKMDEEATDE